MKLGNYIPLRRDLWEHVENGWITGTEALAFIAILVKADSSTGVWWTNWKTLARAIPELTEIKAQTILRALIKKDYIVSLRKVGSRGTYPIVVDKYPITSGTWAGRFVRASTTTNCKTPDLYPIGEIDLFDQDDALTVALTVPVTVQQTVQQTVKPAASESEVCNLKAVVANQDNPPVNSSANSSANPPANPVFETETETETEKSESLSEDDLAPGECRENPAPLSGSSSIVVGHGSVPVGFNFGLLKINGRGLPFKYNSVEFKYSSWEPQWKDAYVEWSLKNKPVSSSKVSAAPSVKFNPLTYSEKIGNYTGELVHEVLYFHLKLSENPFWVGRLKTLQYVKEKFPTLVEQYESFQERESRRQEIESSKSTKKEYQKEEGDLSGYTIV